MNLSFTSNVLVINLYEILENKKYGVVRNSAANFVCVAFWLSHLTADKRLRYGFSQIRPYGETSDMLEIVKLHAPERTNILVLAN